MTYYKFVQAVEERVKGEVGGKITVHKHAATKNNGKVRKGILLMEDGINISPAIYLEEYYYRYQNGNSISDIAVEILDLYKEVKFSHSFEGKKFYIYEQMRDKIIYRLINYEKNKEMLKDVPFVPCLDMAVVFYVLLDVNIHGTATMLIKNEHLDHWELKVADLYRQASENTKDLLPYTFQGMNAVITELSERTGKASTRTTDAMYVLSNRLRSFGAAVILYEDLFKVIGEELKEDYYVLPSSVHEMIVVPKSSAMARNKMREIVMEINKTQVDEEEVLADSVYYYNCAEGKLTD